VPTTWRKRALVAAAGAAKAADGMVHAYYVLSSSLKLKMNRTKMSAIRLQEIMTFRRSNCWLT
jgi:hypothetical protein